MIRNNLFLATSLSRPLIFPTKDSLSPRQKFVNEPSYRGSLTKPCFLPAESSDRCCSTKLFLNFVDNRKIVQHCPTLGVGQCLLLHSSTVGIRARNFPRTRVFTHSAISQKSYESTRFFPNFVYMMKPATERAPFRVIWVTLMFHSTSLIFE